MAFTYKLEHEDGPPADPPTPHCDNELGRRATRSPLSRDRTTRFT